MLNPADCCCMGNTIPKSVTFQAEVTEIKPQNTSISMKPGVAVLKYGLQFFDTSPIERQAGVCPVPLHVYGSLTALSKIYGRIGTILVLRLHDKKAMKFQLCGPDHSFWSPEPLLKFNYLSHFTVRKTRLHRVFTCLTLLLMPQLSSQPPSVSTE